MSRIAAVHGVLAPHRYAQQEITEAVAEVCRGGRADRRLLRRLHAHAGVRFRHTALPLSEYGRLRDFGAVNDVFIATAVRLGAEAVRGALRRAGVAPREVDLLVFTSVTGIAVPSVDARLVGRLGLRPDVRRVPMFGLGCVAGAAGTARLHDYLTGRPGDVAVLLSVELCSLTFQWDDDSPANLVASGLFGDGAAALVMCGADRSGTAAGPWVLETRSRLYPDTERALGWDITGTGFRIVLDATVPDLVRAHLAREVDDLLGAHGLKRQDVVAWVCHPGGPKVLEAVAEALELPPDALETTWRSLARAGNLSSASVLHVLRDTLAARRRPEPGGVGVMVAMGPGFCSELVLLRW